MKRKRVTATLFLLLLCSNLLLLHMFIQNENMEEELYRLQVDKQRLETEQAELLAELEELRYSSRKIFLPDKVANEVEKVSREMVVTAYAPFDPDAVEGMCFEGDPNITYSGEPPIPGETAAGHRDLLGKTVYIEGLGYRRINDIGGAIGRDNIDVVFADKKTALEFGRQTLSVAIIPD